MQIQSIDCSARVPAKDEDIDFEIINKEIQDLDLQATTPPEKQKSDGINKVGDQNNAEILNIGK